MLKLVVVAVLLGLAAADHIDKNAETKSFVNTINPDGQFQYGFETSNGISMQAAGNADQATGSTSWISPEGQAFRMAYVADVNGFQPTGDHLPVAPPVPEYILRSLEWSRAHPVKEEVYKRV